MFSSVVLLSSDDKACPKKKKKGDCVRGLPYKAAATEMFIHALFEGPCISVVTETAFARASIRSLQSN